jgi:hypothetical protein
VLPIRPEQLAKFKQMLSDNQGTVGNTSNYRKLQPIVAHNVRFIGAIHLSRTWTAMMAIVSSVLGYYVFQ